MILNKITEFTTNVRDNVLLSEWDDWILMLHTGMMTCAICLRNLEKHSACLPLVRNWFSALCNFGRH